MKKLLCAFTLLLILAVLAPIAVHADSEATDILSQYSTEDLMLARDIIDSVLASRTEGNGNVSSAPAKEVTVPQGTYTVGVDIPAGTYTVSYNGRLLASVEVSSSAGKAVSYDSISSGGRIGKLNLTNGQIVEIGYDQVVFMPYQGLGF